MVRIRNLSFGYGKESLFRSLDLDLDSGNIYGLLGRNGAGKTSLLRILSGQLYPHVGVCDVLGFEPRRRDPAMIADTYFLPEEFYIPGVTAVEYIETYGSFYPRFERSRMENYLREFELSPSKKLSAYSYGQKKKFLLAFGLSTGCSLLLLDEPTNGMDIPSKSQFRRTVAAALGEHQTIVISTHQVRDMGNLIDPVIILDSGRIIFNESLGEASSRISARVQQEAPAEESVLYSEKVLGGYSVIVENSGEEETSIDIELLFNAVVSGSARIREMFTQEVKA